MHNKTVVTSDVPTAVVLVSTSKGNEIDLLIWADVIGKILCSANCVELTSELTTVKTNLCWSVIGKPNETLNDSYCKDNVLIVLFTCYDEAHFWLNGYVSKQNCRIWSEANPQVYVETPLHPEKLTVWCALWAGGILLQKR
ncbi:uncharacterized protein TNCV_3570301 [Trichonephila clavipes]|nr:uncharacterized protein TNCV_3570301 [Trichonephila clavipes]